MAVVGVLIAAAIAGVLILMMGNTVENEDRRR
jgi:hypothetical protein